MTSAATDAQIRAGRKHHPGKMSLLYPTQVRHFKFPRPDISDFIAGPSICDFFLSFDTTGHVEHAWLFDATPHPRTSRAMHAYAMRIRANRATSGAWAHYATALLMAGTNRHQLR